MELMEYLLKHGGDPNLDDLDSLTPFELFYINNNGDHNDNNNINNNVISLLTPKKDLEKARLQRKEIMRKRTKEKKIILREYVVERYKPKYKEIFSTWNNNHFDEKFLDFINNSNDNNNNNNMEKLKGIIEEVAPRVYGLRLFSMDYCRFIIILSIIYLLFIYYISIIYLLFILIIYIIYLYY
jgi:hypothetical protein